MVLKIVIYQLTSSFLTTGLLLLLAISRRAVASYVPPTSALLFSYILMLCTIATSILLALLLSLGAVKF